VNERMTADRPLIGCAVLTLLCRNPSLVADANRPSSTASSESAHLHALFRAGSAENTQEPGGTRGLCPRSRIPAFVSRDRRAYDPEARAICAFPRAGAPSANHGP
jgi:hypothetical protein